MTIIPAILSDSLEEVQAELDRLARFTPTPRAVQVDIIDGEYTDNLTIDVGDLQQLDTNGLAIDLHLMTIEPVNFLSDLQDYASLRRVIAQVEKMDSISEFVNVVRDELDREAGLSLDLFTRLDDFSDEIIDVLDQVSVVQVMGNHAGLQGQELHPTALETLRQVAEYRARHNLAFEISVDIGMNGQTIPQAAELGATEVVVGSYLQGEKAEERWRGLILPGVDEVKTRS